MLKYFLTDPSPQYHHLALRTFMQTAFLPSFFSIDPVHTDSHNRQTYAFHHKFTVHIQNPCKILFVQDKSSWDKRKRSGKRNSRRLLVIVNKANEFHSNSFNISNHHQGKDDQQSSYPSQISSSSSPDPSTSSSSDSNFAFAASFPASDIPFYKSYDQHQLAALWEIHKETYGDAVEQEPNRNECANDTKRTQISSSNGTAFGLHDLIKNMIENPPPQDTNSSDQDHLC